MLWPGVKPVVGGVGSGSGRKDQAALPEPGCDSGCAGGRDLCAPCTFVGGAVSGLDSAASGSYCQGKRASLLAVEARGAPGPRLERRLG